MIWKLYLPKLWHGTLMIMIDGSFKHDSMKSSTDSRKHVDHADYILAILVQTSTSKSQVLQCNLWKLKYNTWEPNIVVMYIDNLESIFCFKTPLHALHKTSNLPHLVFFKYAQLHTFHTSSNQQNPIDLETMYLQEKIGKRANIFVLLSCVFCYPASLLAHEKADYFSYLTGLLWKKDISISHCMACINKFNPWLEDEENNATFSFLFPSPCMTHYPLAVLIALKETLFSLLNQNSVITFTHYAAHTSFIPQWSTRNAPCCIAGSWIYAGTYAKLILHLNQAGVNRGPFLQWRKHNILFGQHPGNHRWSGHFKRFV